MGTAARREAGCCARFAPLLDPVWTADGYVSDRWRPVSPVTGRLDAFQWLTPVAALPSDKAPVIEADIHEGRCERAGGHANSCRHRG